MAATTVDGTATAAAIRADLTERLGSLADAPDPGGVGPMTRAMPLATVVLAAEQAVGAEALTA